MRFLIDECLTAKLVAICHEFGHEATHVAWLGKQGWKDWSLVRHIIDNDYTFVTNNAADFRREHGKLELHAGQIIIVRQLPNRELLGMFREVLHYIGDRDITNRAIEVTVDNGFPRVDEYPLPE